MKNFDTYLVTRMSKDMREQLKAVAVNRRQSQSALMRQGVLSVLKEFELEQRELVMRQQFMAG